MLARENLLQGKVPTTRTSPSIVAAFQTQEALKIIHDMDVEPGVGLLINGLTNDIYKTEYPVIEDRMHPALDPIVELVDINSEDSTLADLLTAVRTHLGPEAILEFSHELVISMIDSSTGEEELIFKHMARLNESQLTSPTTGVQREMNLTHRITGNEDFLDRTLVNVDFAPLSIVRGRNGDKLAYFEITGDKETFLVFE